jgi:hypothetical protein
MLLPMRHRGESRTSTVASLIAIISACGRVTGNEEATDASAEAQAVADASTPDSTGNGDSSSGVSTPDADAAKSDSKEAGVDSDAGASCDLNTPFGDPQPVAELNTESDEGYARLSPDGLTVYFVRRVVNAGLSPYRRLYAMRPDSNSIFGEAMPVPGSTYDLYLMEEEAFSVTADGLNLYFAQADPGACSGSAVWVQSRPTTDVPFEKPRVVSPPTFTFYLEAYVLPANNALWFTFYSGCAGNVGGVSRSVLVDGGLGPIDYQGFLPQAQSSPAPTPDERFVAGANLHVGRSYLAEHVGKGYVSRTLDELGGVTPSYLSPDACTMLFHAGNRDGGVGGLDIYITKRMPPAKAPAPRN